MATMIWTTLLDDGSPWSRSTARRWVPVATGDAVSLHRRAYRLRDFVALYTVLDARLTTIVSFSSGQLLLVNCIGAAGLSPPPGCGGERACNLGHADRAGLGHRPLE